MKITTGTWLTRNGREVWVSTVWKGGAIGCTRDEECIEMEWNDDGKDSDDIHEWDLVENITSSDEFPCISIDEFEKEL